MSTDRTRGRRLTLLALAAVVLLGVGAVAFRGSSSRGSDTHPKTFSLPALNGPGQVRLADFRGRPTVVNFFASWCSACDAELPQFAKDAQALKGKVNFIGVDSLETGDKNLLVKRHHLASAFTALASDAGGSQNDGLHAALGGGKAMPLTAFYDAHGKLLDVEHGALPPGTLAEAIATLYGITV